MIKVENVKIITMCSVKISLWEELKAAGYVRQGQKRKFF